MSKYERRIFLDRLIELREGYQNVTHEATSMGIDGAMAYAAALYDDAERLDAIVGGSSDAASTSNSPA